MANFDLNLITTFITLYETQSVTTTAQRLFVTQPSVSYALGKLREQFDDALFVRNRQGMQPTRLATQLYGGFKEASRCIDSAVGEARKFEPGHSQRQFRLALSDLGEMALLPRLMERLSSQAPNIELEVIPLEIDQVGTWLSDGHVDAAICSRKLGDSGVVSRVLMKERYVCLLDAAHPRIGETLNMQQFLAEPHVLVTRTSGHGMAEEALQRLGVERRIKLRLPHFSVLPRLIPGTDLLGILPSQIAESFCEMPLHSQLKTLELPFDVPAFEVSLHWHSRSTQSTALTWFLRQVQVALGGAGLA
ncbi:LysR family transcriptional regulator [Pseudomonas cremoricolorata]|uniref:LysR family transcriptional regulator n=1 Tax=Pseudomonas cremoricolorata TaxID=157783 RepID=A0A089WJS0_9PSED|nr:LysR family transcriptional regulator [Pseudomonas cremoricolorata]AIR88851.1 LysR family transcriptional regulator [Pseudomonas cremoricolorata]